MDLKQMLLDTADQHNCARWQGALYAMQDLANHMSSLLENNDVTFKSFSLELTKHLGSEIKRYEELILTTDMGKKMKEIGDKYGT